jgi:hypothetical protein
VTVAGLDSRFAIHILVISTRTDTSLLHMPQLSPTRRALVQDLLYRTQERLGSSYGSSFFLLQSTMHALSSSMAQLVHHALVTPADLSEQNAQMLSLNSAAPGSQLLEGRKKTRQVVRRGCDTGTAAVRVRICNCRRRRRRG